MNNHLRTHSTSRKTAVCANIVLRQTETTRLIFRPELIENPHDSRYCVKGRFIFQKKKGAADWYDYKRLNISHMKDAEWFKLELHSRELFKLISQLDAYYQIFTKYGIRSGDTEFIITSKTVGSTINQLLADKDYVGKLVKQGSADLLLEVLKWMSEIGDARIVIEKLKQLNVSTLQRLNTILGLNTLNKVLGIWESNMHNGNESFWQKMLAEYSWIIGQVFAVPVIIFNEQAYVGGKALDFKGGKLADFIYQNNLTDNIMLVEIKTPTTKLMGAQYRRNVFSISPDLAGALSQVLNDREELQNNYYSLKSSDSRTFYAFNPRCLLIIGCLQTERLNNHKKESFELFRGDQRNIDILTFDELFRKVKLQLEMFEQFIPVGKK
jgi:hypothetical protein